MVAIVVIGTVMAAMAPFLVKSLMVVGQQRSQQVAIEVANDALERVRALDPSSLLVGRGKSETQRQWNAAPAAVATELAAMLQVWDPFLPVASDAGSRAPLPTADNSISIGGTAFAQSWYIGRCWQPKVASSDSTVGTCGPAQAAATDVSFFRIVAAVTWSHRSCVDAQCIYVARTLASTGVDPLFGVNRPPPTITDPASQTGYSTVPSSLQILSTGGRIPLAWSAVGLPPGLTISADGGLVTGTPTTTGTYTVVAKVIDRDARSDNTTFSWIIVKLPALTNPGDQIYMIGRPFTPPVITGTGGLLPVVWSVTNLPAGLTLNPSNGVISGTPNTVQTQTVVVTYTDAGSPARTASITFKWQVLPALKIVDPGTPSLSRNMNIKPGVITLSATGGTPPYVWTVVNLPLDLTVDPATGQITGRTDNKKASYSITITVKDSLGYAVSMPVVWTVT